MHLQLRWRKRLKKAEFKPKVFFRCQNYCTVHLELLVSISVVDTLKFEDACLIPKLMLSAGYGPTTGYFIGIDLHKLEINA